MAGERVPTLVTQRRDWGRWKLSRPSWLLLTVEVGDLDTTQVTAAVTLVVARHEALRAVPVPDTDAAWQHIYEPEDVAIRVYNIAVDDAEWRAVDNTDWPIEKPRWVAGIIEGPSRLLVMKVCHGVSDQVGLRILAGDLTRAMSAIRQGTTPNWRPAASLRAIAAAEASPAGQNLMRRNNDYFRDMLEPGWMIKPLPDRHTRPTWVQGALVIDDDCLRRFSQAALAIGVSWQRLLRASFLLAEEVVQANGRMRACSIVHNRTDDERRRCVANFALALITIIDARQALELDPAEWARRADAQFEASASHLPAAQLTLNAWDDATGEAFGRGAERMPSYEFETSGNVTQPAPDVPGTGNRVAVVRELDEWWWQPMTLILMKHPSETHLTISDHSSRCTAGSLSLLAICWLATIESYAGISGTPEQETFERARELRAAVGRWPDLEIVDGELLAVTSARPPAARAT